MRASHGFPERFGVGNIGTCPVSYRGLRIRHHHVFSVLNIRHDAERFGGLASIIFDDTLFFPESISDVRMRASDNLWVRPSHLDLAAAEMELAGEVGREMILRDRLAQDAAEFDYVILDCPPSLGILTTNALTCSSEVFLPLQPHFLALHGLSKLLGTIDIVAKRLNRGLRLTGVLYCMAESSTRLANEVMGDVEEFFEKERLSRSIWSTAQVFTTKIRKNVRLAEAPSFGQSILEYAPTSNGAQDYRALAEEVAVMQQMDELVRAA